MMAALKCVMKSDCGVIRFVPDVIRIMDEPKSKLKKSFTILCSVGVGILRGDFDTPHTCALRMDCSTGWPA